MLLNSEPSALISITKKATWSDKIDTFYNAMGYIIFAIGFNAIIADKGVTIKELMKKDMHFMLGHRAMSFAFLTPPNFRYLGFFTMKEHVPNPLPKPMLNFMDGCGDRPIIYMSFGSFLPDPARLTWLKDFLHDLLKTDVCLLLKAYPESRKELALPSDRVYIQYWMPQKDILAHKKNKFFPVPLW